MLQVSLFKPLGPARHHNFLHDTQPWQEEDIHITTHHLATPTGWLRPRSPEGLREEADEGTRGWRKEVEGGNHRKGRTAGYGVKGRYNDRE